MSKNLVIVESPAKAKTIEGYLGKDYTVTSSFGHVRDLPKGSGAVDVDNGFKPTYEIPKDKQDVVKNLRKLAKSAELVYLASDDDREGEAISWHLSEALDLNEDNAKRIVFREITKNAIQKAIDKPRKIDYDLVHAQQARRILDRLVGFELSPILWKKIRAGLSAGRVQSVAVRLVVEKEREVEKFQSTSSFRVQADFNLDKGAKLKSELSEKLKTEEETLQFLEECKGSDFSIESLEKKPSKKSPAPPFTTSTLQQEASRKLGYSVSKTMTLAQKLYESGKITYMRTDSVNLSDEAIGKAKNAIHSSYGDNYFKERHYKTKSSGAQEAHEAIRPTDFSKEHVDGDSGEQRLYELIWKRAIASQMSEAQIEKTQAKIKISKSSRKLTANGEVIKFDGFLKVYIESTDEEHEDEGNVTKSGMLPPLSIGQDLDLDNVTSREVFTRHSARYTEASLVKKLEEMGIGRPSTYAPTISTIQKRGYVEKESREGKPRKYIQLVLAEKEIKRSEEEEITGVEKNKLFPTDLAMVVNDFLVGHFNNVLDYSFTARVEEQFDEIADGKAEWDEMIHNFYSNFHVKVEETENIERSSIQKSRELGIDSASGEAVVAKLGKFGPYVQIGEGTETEKPKSASLRKGQLMETITMEEAMELFKLPREVGNFEEKSMVAAIGRFGPYIRHDGKFYSLGKEDDPHTIEEARSIEIIKNKREADAKKLIKSFEENEEIQVLNGRWGPYIKAGKKNVKIPKGKEPEELTLEECLELAEKTPEKKGRGRKK
ncbi:MAG: type I DNA topoisomerase [Bacteroidota bacterium]